uniref:Potassium channel domain-containing protein n=1 Tax=Heterorhabditis bacteriophora TaxID=37862 RepID=A0A1I7XC99_HETBA
MLYKLGLKTYAKGELINYHQACTVILAYIMHNLQQKNRFENMEIILESYNRITPITYAGRLFCIVYGICGIPITMIIIANVGQYLNNFAGDSRRKVSYILTAIDFFNGLYYNFLCLTAIDFGQLVPSRVAFLPITFLYVCLGLAITTIAIDYKTTRLTNIMLLKQLKDKDRSMKYSGAHNYW